MLNKWSKRVDINNYSGSNIHIMISLQPIEFISSKNCNFFTDSYGIIRWNDSINKHITKKIISYGCYSYFLDRKNMYNKIKLNLPSIEANFKRLIYKNYRTSFIANEKEFYVSVWKHINGDWKYLYLNKKQTSNQNINIINY
jgi:hypothetical protein